MNSCPKCQQEIEADFGMVTCPSCGVVVFVGMDGEIKVHGEDESPQEVIEPVQEPIEVEEDQWSPQDELIESQVESELVSDDGEDELIENLSEDLEVDRFADENQAEEDFSDVVDFGNSEVSQASEGVFVYSVTVEGIDTKEIRQDVLDHLQDRRLCLGDSLENISDGVLHLRDLNPVKASLIVNRLRSVDVKVQWIQYAITEMDIVGDFSSESSDSGGG